MKLVVDSSVFISALGIRDIYSVSSRNFFGKISTHQIYLPALVVAEILVAIKKQKGKNLVGIYEQLASFEIINLDREYLDRFAGLIPASPSLKTSDLIIAIASKLYKATLITWDKKLLSFADSICPILRPDEFV